MYTWIWRHLPFGLPGRLVGSVLLAAATGALLWFVVFPAVDPHLPFNNDGQVSQTGGGQTGGGQPDQDSVVPASPSPSH